MTRSEKETEEREEKPVTEYHYETDEVYPVPEGVTVLDEVHDVGPSLQGDHQEYGHPGQADVVEADGSVERVGGAGGAGGVVLVPVHAARPPLPPLLHREAARPPGLLVAGQVDTLVHPVAGLRGADEGRHEVVLLQLVVEAGDAGDSEVSQLKTR